MDLQPIATTLAAAILKASQEADRAARVECAEICETSEVLLLLEDWGNMKRLSAATAVEVGRMIRDTIKEKAK